MINRPRKLTSLTIVNGQPVLPENKKSRRRLMDYSRRRSTEDAIARAVHKTLKGEAGNEDVIAALSLTEHRVFVERVGLLSVDDRSHAIELPSLPATLDRAPASALLLNIEAAVRAILHKGESLNGLFVPLFETGISSIDRESKRLADQLADDGFYFDQADKRIIGDIRRRAIKLVPGRASWRRDMKVAFAPTEKVFGLASEKVAVEQWLKEMEDLYGGDPYTFLKQVLSSVQSMGANAATRASGIYAVLLNEVTRRLKSISAGIGENGPTLTFELREPANDDDPSDHRDSA